MNRLPIYATIAVALASGVLAAVATSEVALSTGAVSHPVLGWTVPVILEGGALTAALLAWRRTGAGLKAAPERLALLVLIALAVVVNASHASGEHLLGVVIAACPPLILLASVELLLRNRGEHLESEQRAVKAAAKRERSMSKAPSAPQSAVKAAPQVKAQQGAPKASVALVEAPGGATDWLSLSGDEKRARVSALLAEDPALTGAQLAALVGCGASTARRLLAEVREHRAA